MTRTFFVKVEAEKIRAGFASSAGVGPIGDAADFTRTTTRLLLPGRGAEELDERGSRSEASIRCSPMRNASKPASWSFCKSSWEAEAGFADGDAIFWDASDQFERSLDADVERLQVAVVDADDAAANGESAAEFLGRVNFTSGSIPSSRRGR